MPNKTEIIEHIPLSAIAVDLEWNARSGAWMDYDQSDIGDDFTGLKASIEACGVKEPVKVRPVRGCERPYALVSGFRRYIASLQLELETIPAIVREMTESEARLENTRENAVRQRLNTPDLAWAVAQLVKQGMTDTEIARGIGRSQAYVSQLHRIMTDLEPRVTDFWRSCPVLLPVDMLYSLCKVPRTEQWERFHARLHRKEEKAGRTHRNGRLQRLAKNACEFGSTLGKLVRLKYVSEVSGEFEDMVENVIRIPGSTLARHRKALADAMAKGYEEGSRIPIDDDGN
jgi:ParB/RepB/Spo0J family partition protein